MRNVIVKKASSATNQIIAIERSQTKKLNMSTLDEIVDERYRCDGFFLWIQLHTNDFVKIFATSDNTLSLYNVLLHCSLTTVTK